MYDIPLQPQTPSFAPRNNIHNFLYGDNLLMHYHFPVRAGRVRKENITFTFYNLKNNEYYHAHAIYSQYNHSSNINVELNI